ncbi:MAG: hypothetical protein N2B06_18690 [Clostridium sp.]
MDMTKTIIIIYNVFGFLIILKTLYRVSHHGKLITKAYKNRFWAIFSVILWTGVGITECILGYSNYTRNDNIFFVLIAILWFEISIFSIIRGLHSSEIRENGIYASGNFYKWSRVQSYSWILPTTIQFKVNTAFIANCNFEFTIKDELKSKANETVQKYVL